MSMTWISLTKAGGSTSGTGALTVRQKADIINIWLERRLKVTPQWNQNSLKQLADVNYNPLCVGFPEKLAISPFYPLCFKAPGLTRSV